MSSKVLGGKEGDMGISGNILPNCQRTKFNLKLPRAGRPRYALEPGSSSTGVRLKNGAARLLDFFSLQCKSLRWGHIVSFADTFKGDILIPFLSGGKDSIDQTGDFSCQSTSSSLFRFTSGSQAIIEISHLRITSSCRGGSEYKSHLKPFITLPGHAEESFVLSGLIDHRIEPYIPYEMFWSGESIHRIAYFPDDSSHSNFTYSGNREEYMVRIEGIQETGNLGFYSFNLFLKLDNSLCSPFNFVSEEGSKFRVLEEGKEGEEFLERRRERNSFNIFRGGIRGEKRKELWGKLISTDSLIPWIEEVKVLSEPINVSGSLLNEGSSESGKGAKPELGLGVSRGRGFRESFEEFGNHKGIDSVSFREFEMRFSELLNTIRVDKPDGKAFTFTVSKESLQVTVPVSSGLKSYNDGTSFPQESGESEDILAKKFKSLGEIRVSMYRGKISPCLVHETDFQRIGGDIYTHEKSFRTHKPTSFLESNCGYLVSPFFPDGYYPPGLRARSTSCNQISPSGVGEPSSLSCSGHTRNEGLFACLKAGNPDTLTVLNFKSSGDINKLRLLTM